jgi:hypothetical protein
MTALASRVAEVVGPLFEQFKSTTRPGVAQADGSSSGIIDAHGFKHFHGEQRPGHTEETALAVWSKIADDYAEAFSRDVAMQWGYPNSQRTAKS